MTEAQGVDSLMIVAFIVLVRYVVCLLEKALLNGRRFIWPVIVFFSMISCALPMTLIELGYLEKTALNVIISVIFIFYMAFVFGRVGRKPSQEKG